MFRCRRGRFSVSALVVYLVVGCSACGGGTHSPTAPALTPTVRPNVGISSLAVTGEARATGYAYRIIVHLRESAGVAATISSVDLTFMRDSTAVVSSHFDQPISDTSNVCPANGTVDTRELLTVDEASHAYATTVQAKVTFADSSLVVGAANGTADVPPPRAPAPPQTFTLTGVITDVSTHVGIASARVDVLNGLNAGKAASTDSTGTYVMRELMPDSFRLRASANDYGPGEQSVTVPSNPRADFELRRAGCVYKVSPNAITISRGGFAMEGISIDTSPGCAWTATADDWIISRISPPGGGGRPVSGTGPAYISLTSNVHDFCIRTGAVKIRWIGGGADVKVTQPSPLFGYPPCTP